MLLKLGNFIRHPSKNSSMESHDVRKSCMEIHCTFLVILLQKLFAKLTSFARFLCRNLVSVELMLWHKITTKITKIHILHDRELVDIHSKYI